VSGPSPKSAYSFASAGKFSSIVNVSLRRSYFCRRKTGGSIVRVSGVRVPPALQAGERDEKFIPNRPERSGLSGSLSTSRVGRKRV